jgi:hypothetical protein
MTIAGARTFDTKEGQYAAVNVNDHGARRWLDWRRREFGAILVHHVVAAEVCAGLHWKRRRQQTRS